MKASRVKLIAEAYGRRSEAYASMLDPTLKPMAEEILRIGGLHEQDRVMDLATGTGLIARTAAAVSHSVVGVDISLGMLGEAWRLTSRKVVMIAGDAVALPFVDGSFDLVTCGISLSHFRDVSAALDNIRRLLSPGGRLVASAWSSEKEDPSCSAVFEVLEKYMREMANPFTGLVDEARWASSEHGCEELERAGFAEVQVTTLPLSGMYRNPSAAMRWAFAWPLIGDRLDILDTTRRHELQVEAIEEVDAVGNLAWRRAVHYYKAINPA